MFDNILYWQDCDETDTHMPENANNYSPQRRDTVKAGKRTHAFTFKLCSGIHSKDTRVKKKKKGHIHRAIHCVIFFFFPLCYYF